VEPAGGRRVLVPAFSAIAETAIGTVPGEVAAATVVAVSRLGSRCLAPDQAGQGHDVPGADARVGIYHRLLFRADARRLEVLDLVTRPTDRRLVTARGVRRAGVS